MSRVAKSPVLIPNGVEITLQGQHLQVKGKQGSLEHLIHQQVEVKITDRVLTFIPREPLQAAVALAGTTRALVHNMVQGVAQGFQKKLVLVGVGYRAQVQGAMLNLTLGYSHPINFAIPAGITIESQSPTEMTIKGSNKQLVGQVAANIRAFRPPEPYKGKGVRYADETILLKEAKKK
ncbi:MAG: 50S ribosomal protein L6 [Beggiatoa sp. IS2]|nr:MAG: 50S ribosomal protein L6 [Beggiatoa sp. IS2]